MDDLSPNVSALVRGQDASDAPVHVVFAVDAGFLAYTAIALWSAATHTRNLHVHIIHGGNLGPGAQGLRRIVERFGGRIEFYEACLDKLDGLPVTDHVSIATYFRLSIAELLPADIERVIYLDGDLIVRRSLQELYDWPIDAPGVAAVPEPHAWAESLGMPAGTAYLNAGVLVLDLRYWRQAGVTAKLYEIASAMKDRLRFWDQDILALYLQGKWSFLPSHWNVHHRYFFGASRLPWPQVEPAIVHFSGAGLKPPDGKVVHPFADEFWSLAQQVAPYGFSLRSPSRLKAWARRLRLWRAGSKTTTETGGELRSRRAS